MKPNFVRIGRHIVNLASIADAHWERDVLYVHFDGGRFAQLRQREAELIWQAIEAYAVDLETGEVVSGV